MQACWQVCMYAYWCAHPTTVCMLVCVRGMGMCVRTHGPRAQNGDRHTCAHAFMHSCIWDMCVPSGPHALMHIHALMHSCRSCMYLLASMEACMYACMYVCFIAGVLLHVPRMLFDAPLILSARQRRRNMHDSHVCGLAPSHPDSRASSCAYLPCTPCVHCMCRFTRRRYRRRTRTRTFVRHTPIPMQIRLCAYRYRKIRARAPTRILCRYARVELCIRVVFVFIDLRICIIV
jgi:hypothetical protein